MSNFKKAIKSTIVGSEIFNKTTDFLSETQRRFKAEQALDAAKCKLDALYLELGKTAYKKRPITEGRTQAVIREEIATTLVEVETLQKAFEEMNPPQSEESDDSEPDSVTPETSENDETT